MSIQKVGVIGCGLMGSGIAQVCAQKGHPTVVREINDQALQKGLDRIRGFLAEGVKRGKVAQAQMDQTLANLKGTTALADLKDCDLVIEAVVENLDEKRKVFAELDKICGPATIFASNTSSISITAQAAATKRMDRFIGLHFMNPVPIMKLVEIVRPEVTSNETYAAAEKTMGLESLVALVATTGSFSMTCMTASTFGIEPPANDPTPLIPLM